MSGLIGGIYVLIGALMVALIELSDVKPEPYLNIVAVLFLACGVFLILIGGCNR